MLKTWLQPGIKNVSTLVESVVSASAIRSYMIDSHSKARFGETGSNSGSGYSTCATGRPSHSCCLRKRFSTSRTEEKYSPSFWRSAGVTLRSSARASETAPSKTLRLDASRYSMRALSAPDRNSVWYSTLGRPIMGRATPSLVKLIRASPGGFPHVTCRESKRVWWPTCSATNWSTEMLPAADALSHAFQPWWPLRPRWSRPEKTVISRRNDAAGSKTSEIW